MAQVTLPYSLTAGSPENVNNLMSNLTALRDGVNTIDTAQIASNAVTADKLSTAVANAAGINQTGVTNRAAMTAMTTERTTTSFSFTDVTGASLSFTVASGAYIIVGYSAEIKQASGVAIWRVLADAAICNSQSTENPGNATGVSSSSTYFKTGGMAMFSAAELGTGSKTFKWQFATYGISGTPTAYLKNAYLTVTQVTF